MNAARTSPPLPGQSARWRALRHRLYRWWAAGLAVSLVGTWCQTVTIAGVVVLRSGDGIDLAVLTTCAALPSLLLSLWGGSVADRSGRATLVGLQVASAAVALGVAGTLSTTRSMTPLFGLVLIQGCISAVDLPCRHRLIPDLVAGPDLPSAMAVQSVIQVAGRAAGALVAALLLGAGAPAWGAVTNAVSCLVLALFVRRLPRDVFTAVSRGARPERLLAGVRDIVADDLTRTLLTMLLPIGGLALTTEVLLPLTAARVGDPALTGWLIFSFSVAALSSAWALARRDQVSVHDLSRWAALLSVAFCFLAVPGTAAVALAGAALAGRACGLFVTGVATALQAAAAPAVRGRVMALFVLAVNGTTPIGDPVIGLTAETAGLAGAYVIAAGAAATAALVGVRDLRRRSAEQ